MCCPQYWFYCHYSDEFIEKFLVTFFMFVKLKNLTEDLLKLSMSYWMFLACMLHDGWFSTFSEVTFI